MYHVIRSNRTFMELKFQSANLLLYFCFGSNRTFMELKSKKEGDCSQEETF